MIRSVFVIIVVALFFSCSDKPVSKSALGYFGPGDVNENGDSVYHVIPSFSFINQYGKIVNDKDYDGKIYVADFFFTTCDNICPKMTKQLLRVQEAFKNDNDILILSHTVDPEEDSVEVLLSYAREMKADSLKWNFVTGDKKELYDIAYSGYFANVLEVPDSPGDEDDFIHSENLILVDPDKHIRGIYEGTNPSEVDRLIRDIKILKKELQQTAEDK